MRAIVIDEFGDADRMQLREVDDPKVGPDSVLIRVQAAGINPVDTKIRQGRLEGGFPHHFPLVLGWDAAGVVEAVGPAVVDLEPGDPVYAYCRKTEIAAGTYAELAAMPAGAVARRPRSVDVVHAGGLPLVGLTAWQALVEGARVEAGQTVLVTAASGGVGHVAVQIARDLGARVVGTASERNHDFVRSLGADAVVDYGAQDVEAALREAAPEGFDAALDLVGGDGQAQAEAVLKDGGALVSIVDPSVKERSRVRGHYTFVRPSAAELVELAERVDDGRLRVEVQETLPLERAADAHRLLERGHVRGKVVLEV
ncbi:NADP-dependent oxidoreductase [Conexibacter sp. SYSU D00693]|uniref:NADP-dependent oxidoreductase n=1 Tax=Conexibacter sp. SYSU D00693 TaxID=2812560 RepID=UPI00196A837B|nr:NADP-dependent oxidoreductase [Conexibacter sp. SYSU D00693]